MGFSYKSFKPEKIVFDNFSFNNGNYSHNNYDYEKSNLNNQNIEVVDISVDNSDTIIPFKETPIEKEGIPFHYNALVNHKDGSSSLFENGNFVGILCPKSNIVLRYGKCFRYDAANHMLYPVSIYDEENFKTNQYGANQMMMAGSFESYIQRPKIWEEMQKYYPIESFDSEADAYEFYERYFNVITNSGCGYAAAADIIFDEYRGKEEAFYETFGFDMYYVSTNKDGEAYVNYNYELLELELFNYCNKDKTLEEMEKELDADDSFFYVYKQLFVENKHPAMDGNAPQKYFNEEYDLDIAFDGDKINRFPFFDSDDNINKTLYDEYNNNDYLLYGGSGYDLYNMDGTLYYADGDPHYMLIVGWTEDNKPIVTSWGRKFVLDVHGDETDLLDTYRLYRYNFD